MAGNGFLRREVLETLTLDASLAQQFLSSGRVARKKRIGKLSDVPEDVGRLVREAEALWNKTYDKYPALPFGFREVLADLELKMYVNGVLRGEHRVSFNGYVREGGTKKQYKQIDINKDSYISPPLS